MLTVRSLLGPVIFVHYREVSTYVATSSIDQLTGKSTFETPKLVHFAVPLCPLFGVSSIRGSTVVPFKCTHVRIYENTHNVMTIVMMMISLTQHGLFIIQLVYLMD